MGSYDEPIYDPFGDRGPTHYHPANQAALHLVALQLIFRDIWKLRQMRARSSDVYQRTLVCKYIIIELVSLDQHVSSLAQEILSGRVGYELNHQQFADTKNLYKEYKAARKEKWRELKSVRDKLSAHRDTLDLLTVSKLWDQIDIRAINRILKAFVPLLRLFMNVNVYEWTKKHRDGTFSFIQPIGKIEFEST